MPLAALLTAVALYCLVRAVIAWPADPLGSLTPVAVVAVGAPAVVAVLIVAAGRARRTRRYRIDPGGSPAAAVNHEVAHADKGVQLGGRVVKGRVHPDGSGYVAVRMPCNAPIEHYVAVDMAGARGEGENFYTSPHAGGDRANAASRVAHLAEGERERVYREAERLAAPRWWVSGSAAAMRRALETTGRYR